MKPKSGAVNTDDISVVLALSSCVTYEVSPLYFKLIEVFLNVLAKTSVCNGLEDFQTG